MNMEEIISKKQPANVSKFQELIELRKDDYKKTYEYVESHFEVIDKFANQLIKYFECNPKNLCYLDVDQNKQYPIGPTYRNSIIIDAQGAFNFKLLLLLEESNEPAFFNINNCGKSFSENELVPPAGLIINASILLDEFKEFHITIQDFDQNNCTTKTFLIAPKENNLFLEVFEFIFLSMKNFLNGGLDERIKLLKKQKTNSKLGFYYP